MPKLDTGDRLPDLTADRVDGEQMTLPGDVERSWSMIVFYRGHW